MANNGMPSTGTGTDEQQWAPVSDLMAALMLIFMCIAVLFVRDLFQIEKSYQETCDSISEEYDREFEADFLEWDAVRLDDLTIRFRSPEVLFGSQSDSIRPMFRRILDDFFPRYLRIARQHEVENNDPVTEIRIEGHTSTAWHAAGTDSLGAYFLNMKLSQDRTRSILQFVMNSGQVDAYREWARSRITANGMSSSRPILGSDGREDANRSRRVEFRLHTTACRRAGIYDDN